MPSVIADTSPLQYLHQIGCLGLLADLFQRVIVPDGVAQEIQRGARQGVDLPDLGQLPWVLIQATSPPADSRVSVRLGHGEREVLCWVPGTPYSIIDAPEGLRGFRPGGLQWDRP